MKKSQLGFGLVLLLSSALVFGCANNEVVKSTVAVETTEETAAETTVQVLESVEPETVEEELQILGGIHLAKSPNMPLNMVELVEKAMADHSSDETFIPVAYIGRQADSGENHFILCNAVPNVKGAAGRYVIVDIYEDLSHNVELKDILYSEAEAASDEIHDGWDLTDSKEITNEIKEHMYRYSEGRVGAINTPIAFVESSSQNGQSYGLLCLTQGVPNDPGAFTYMIMHVDASGNPRITEQYDFAGAGSH